MLHYRFKSSAQVLLVTLGGLILLALCLVLPNRLAQRSVQSYNKPSPGQAPCHPILIIRVPCVMSKASL